MFADAVVHGTDVASYFLPGAAVACVAALIAGIFGGIASALAERAQTSACLIAGTGYFLSFGATFFLQIALVLNAFNVVGWILAVKVAVAFLLFDPIVGFVLFGSLILVAAQLDKWGRQDEADDV